MEIFYPESRFAGFTQVDGTIAFYSRVQALATPETVLVDFGCGRGAYAGDPIVFRRDLRVFKGKVRRVIGLDAGPAGVENPFLDEFHCLTEPRWPLADASANLVLCDNVLEHLPEPRTFFDEARRVLVPGGVVCIRTPNRWNYIALIARLLPGRRRAQALARAKPDPGRRRRLPHPLPLQHPARSSARAGRERVRSRGLRLRSRADVPVVFEGCVCAGRAAPEARAGDVQGGAVCVWEEEVASLTLASLQHTASYENQKLAPSLCSNVTENELEIKGITLKIQKEYKFMIVQRDG